MLSALCGEKLVTAEDAEKSSLRAEKKTHMGISSLHFDLRIFSAISAAFLGVLCV